MTIGLERRAFRKPEMPGGSVSPWVSPGPSIAIPLTWQLGTLHPSVSQCPSCIHSALPTTHRLLLLGPHSIAITGFCFPNIELPGRSLSPLLLVQTQISCCFPLAHHTGLPETKRINQKETGSTYSQEIPLTPEVMPSNVLRSGKKDSMEWTCLLGQPITPPYAL